MGVLWALGVSPLSQDLSLYFPFLFSVAHP